MEIEIISRDCWFKVVEMLQQNWALLEPNKEKSGLVLYFISDTSGIFDQIEFDNSVEAERQLWLNGFGKYAEDKQAQGFISPPPAAIPQIQPSQRGYLFIGKILELKVNLQMLTELRDWLMSAGEGWAGEGATYPPSLPYGDDERREPVAQRFSFSPLGETGAELIHAG